MTALYRIPQQTAAYAQSVFASTNNLFPNLLAKDNIALQYGASPQIITGQTTNFAPRVGVAYSPNLKTVVRAGYGIFYGGLESSGLLRQPGPELSLPVFTHLYFSQLHQHILPNGRNHRRQRLQYRACQRLCQQRLQPGAARH